MSALPTEPRGDCRYAVAAGIHAGACEPVPDCGWDVEWFRDRSAALERFSAFIPRKRGAEIQVPSDHPSAVNGHACLVRVVSLLAPDGAGNLSVVRTVAVGCKSSRYTRSARREATPQTPHDVLVGAAEKWLRGTMRCSAVIAEMASAASERPDAIGWANGWSVLVECKASRVDFLADAAKPFRAYPDAGMGRFRWYFTQPGLIASLELPSGWGLAEYDGEVVRRVAEAAARDSWNRDAEIRHLVSAVRRNGGDQ